MEVTLTERNVALTEDLWSDWLLHRRHADDTHYGSIVQTKVNEYADRVLDGAKLQPGMTLADIGSGEGLIAFRAIDRIGASLQTILTDLSAPMLRCARAIAVEREIDGQCSFIECGADKLIGIRNGSVDVATTRSVLAYVRNKPAALAELYRILSPGGRISLAEPIFQDEAYAVRTLRSRVEAAGEQSIDLFLKLLHRWRSSQFPDNAEEFDRNPLTNFSERNLLNMVLNSGFVDVHLELHIDVRPAAITNWDVFIGTSPHPWAPSLKTILAEQFTAEERSFFERIIRPSVESGANTETDRMVFITATKPN